MAVTYSRICSALVLLFLPLCATANSPGLYFSAFTDQQSVGVSNSEFKPVVGSVVLGFWGWDGIGFEAELGRGLSDSSVGNLDLEITSLAALNLRLESPGINNIAAYVQLGVAHTNLESRFSRLANTSLDTTFNGARLALGLTIEVAPAWRVDAGFSHHEYDDDIGINSFRLGVRYTTDWVAGRFRK